MTVGQPTNTARRHSSPPWITLPVSVLCLQAAFLVGTGCSDTPTTDAMVPGRDADMAGRDAGGRDAGPEPDTGPEPDACAALPCDDGGRDAGPQPDGGTPVSCAELDDATLLSLGYEPVRAHGATGDGATDDTAAIQTTIDVANRARRVVYFHPGDYLISDTLWLRQDADGIRGNDNDGRYGQVVQGSYCGDRPTLRLADGVAPETDEQVIAAEPFAMLLLMRNQAAGDATPPDESLGARDWNQTVRNLHLVLGNNPGAVGIRHQGAEGSSAQQVSIDARGGFAGFYQLNSSGGYTYDVEVRGGRYGLYLPSLRGGGAVIAGLHLYEQQGVPIAFSHYGPITFVGFDIEHDTGPIIGGITGPETHYVVSDRLPARGDSGGHVAFVDGTIDLAQDSVAITSAARSVYLENVHVRGTATLIDNGTDGDLRAGSTGVWTHVSDYSYSTQYGGPARLVGGSFTPQTLLNGAYHPPAEDLVVGPGSAPPPADLRGRHLYASTRCNVEANDAVFVTDHGADPDDTQDDTAAIQAAIDAAPDGAAVFMPAAAASASGSIDGAYRIRGSLRLRAGTHLCGITRYSSILSAIGWTPTESGPVISTVDDVDATTTIADFKIVLPPVDGNAIDGYAPYPYAIHWEAGRHSLVRDVYYQSRFGEKGDRRSVVIDKSGGGRWWGVTQHGGQLPPLEGEGRPFRDTMGRLRMSPAAAHMLIAGTTEPLTFYMYHAQHLTQPQGALTWIEAASHVRFLGIKSEMGSVPERMAEIVHGNPPDLVPIWMFIRDSDDVRLIGHETLAQTARGRGLIEVSASTNVRIVHYGRRDGAVESEVAEPESTWYFVLDGTVGVRASDFLSVYESLP